MSLLNLDREAYEAASDWTGGMFPSPKEGVGIPFEILGDDKAPRVESYEDKKTGEPYEALIVSMATVSDDEKDITYNEFFRLDDPKAGIPKLKSFFAGIFNRKLTSAEVSEFDTDVLIGCRFVCDVTKSVSNGKTYTNLDYKTIVTDDPMELPESTPEPSKPARPGRPARR